MKIKNLHSSEKIYILGTMSGTSLDGLDLAWTYFDGEQYNLHDFESIPFSTELKKFLCQLTEQKKLTLDFILKVESAYNNFAIQNIKSFCKNKKVDLIGFSGQTIRHLPKERITWQIGSPGILAGAIGITTVGDFRTQDMGAGGQGAPLVSFVDYVLFSGKTARILLNIGGIANLTFIDNTTKRCIAFDTGPGNMLIDSLMRHLYNKPYDLEGEIAAQGKCDIKILDELLKLPYFSMPPPKSTGRIDFGSDYMQRFLKITEHLSKEDKLATATHLTTKTISNSIEKFIPVSTGNIIVSGGGKQNKTIMNHLYNNLKNWEFESLQKYGINEQAKESFAFAVLAHHTILGKINQIPSATGAKRELCLGAIYHG